VVNYVFLDEVQNVQDFEKLLEGLYIHLDVDLYVTGSNAYLLSSELATLLTGRAFEIHVLPFSFKEFLEFSSSSSSVERFFADYLRTGGFPEAVKLSGDGQMFAYQ
jgi:predicted AAA+ superfamily ATPase